MMDMMLFVKISAMKIDNFYHLVNLKYFFVFIGLFGLQFQFRLQVNNKKNLL